MDVLTDVLESIHARSLFLGRFELTAPWGLSFEGPGLGFCLVTRGTGILEAEGAPGPITLAGGDFVLLQKKQKHSIRDSMDSPIRPACEVLQTCPNQQGCQPGGIFRYGGGGAPTTLIGGRFEIEDGEHNPLLRSLPSFIHIQGDRGNPVPWLETTLQFVSSEMASGLPGASTVVSRLADVLLVQAVRSHLSQHGDGTGNWLRALVDPQIGQALSLMHAEPHAPWTVQLLAERVAMSRSSFSARFSDLVEEPPLTYLTRWRMSKASRLLHQSTASVGEVATRVGYDAEAAFSKAFKRWSGIAPGAYRRRRDLPPSTTTPSPVYANDR
jgi:AraC-like DNA-binding protein